MSWLIAAAFGLAVGLLGSFLIRPDRRNYIADAATGIAGALLGTWFFGNVLAFGGALTTSIGTISFISSIWAVVGAIVFVAITQAAIWTGEERAAKGPTYYEELREKRAEKRDRK